MLFRIAPVTGDSAGTMHTGFNIEHRAQGALFIDLLHDQEILVPAAVLVYGEDHMVLVCLVDHLLQQLAAQGDGLLADHILAMAHGVDADLVVHIVGDGHCHQINRGIAEQFFPRSIRMYTRFFRRLVALGLDIIHAAQLDAFVLQGEQLFHMPATHAAVADNGYAKFLVHFLSSFNDRAYRRGFVSPSGWNPVLRPTTYPSFYPRTS